MCSDNDDKAIELHDFPVMCVHGIRALGVDEYVWDTPSWLKWVEASVKYEKTHDESVLRGFGGAAVGALSSASCKDPCYHRTETMLGCPYVHAYQRS